jgi:cytochrome c556
MNLWKVSTIALTLALGTVAGGSLVNAAPADDQPHMQSALDHLKAAKTALDAAAHDHGGHRAKAVKATELAISEVQQGIDYAKQHPEPKGGGPNPKGGGGPNPKGGGGPQPKG